MSEINEKPNIEQHEKIKQLTSNWKMIGIISAFINRCLLDKSELNSNVSIKGKKPLLMQNIKDPSILNVSNVDIYSFNLFRQIHQSFDVDLQYLQQNDSSEIKHVYSQEIPPHTQNLLNHLLIALTTMNEHLFNFISNDYENLYDQKFKKVIDYLFSQREYYLSIGQAKMNLIHF